MFPIQRANTQRDSQGTLSAHVVRIADGGKEEAGVSELLGTILFFAAIGLTAAKLNEDFGQRGEVGYAVLLLLIAIFAAAVGTAFA